MLYSIINNHICIYIHEQFSGALTTVIKRITYLQELYTFIFFLYHIAKVIICL